MFGLFESSRTLGTPLELYRFQVAGQVFSYCDGDDAFTYAGTAYEPVPIKHSAINASGTLDRTTLTVTVADNTPLAAVLRGYPLSSVMTLTVRQGHQADPDAEFLVAWAGRVLSAKRGDPGERVLTCQPVSTSLKRSGLRRNWQYPCPHVLYGDQCRASMVAATVSVVPTAATRNQVIVPTGWNAHPLEKYMGGLVSWGSEVRTILRSMEELLVLGGPATFEIGTTLSVSLGCNHLMSDCSTLHIPVDEVATSNIHNFGGQPFIPTTNPVGYVNLFPGAV